MSGGGAAHGADSNSKRRLDLGWIAGGSVVQPAKRREIEGVSMTSIMDLQAQLYQAQEGVRMRQSGDEGTDKQAKRKGGFDVKSVMGAKNAGVEARDQRDRLHLKSASDKMAESYAALERKAALYDKLAHGHADDDEERYEVDFLNKQGWLHGDADGDNSSRQPGNGGSSGTSLWAGLHQQAPIDTTGLATRSSGGLLSEDMAREQQRRNWEEEEKQRAAEEKLAEERRRTHKEAVLDVAQQTRQQREKAVQQKQQKEQQAQTRVEKLKETFLKKQLEKEKQKHAGKQQSLGKG